MESPMCSIQTWLTFFGHRLAMRMSFSLKTAMWSMPPRIIFLLVDSVSVCWMQICSLVHIDSIDRSFFSPIFFHKQSATILCLCLADEAFARSIPMFAYFAILLNQIKTFKLFAWIPPIKSQLSEVQCICFPKLSNPLILSFCQVSRYVWFNYFPNSLPGPPTWHFPSLEDPTWWMC